MNSFNKENMKLIFINCTQELYDFCKKNNSRKLSFFVEDFLNSDKINEKLFYEDYLIPKRINKTVKVYLKKETFDKLLNYQKDNFLNNPTSAIFIIFNKYIKNN